MSTVLTFGRHKGQSIDRVPASYLGWLADNPTMFPWARKMASREITRRRDEARAKAFRDVPDDLPRGIAGTVLGVELDEIEAGLLDLAIARGELVVTPCLPVYSPVPEAWRRWCEFHDLEHRVRHVTIEEHMKAFGEVKDE